MLSEVHCYARATSSSCCNGSNRMCRMPQEARISSASLPCSPLLQEATSRCLFATTDVIHKRTDTLYCVDHQHKTNSVGAHRPSPHLSSCSSSILPASVTIFFTSTISGRLHPAARTAAMNSRSVGACSPSRPATCSARSCTLVTSWKDAAATRCRQDVNAVGLAVALPRRHANSHASAAVRRTGSVGWAAGAAPVAASAVAASSAKTKHQQRACVLR